MSWNGIECDAINDEGRALTAHTSHQTLHSAHVTFLSHPDDEHVNVLHVSVSVAPRRVNRVHSEINKCVCSLVHA